MSSSMVKSPLSYVVQNPEVPPLPMSFSVEVQNFSVAEPSLPGGGAAGAGKGKREQGEVDTVTRSGYVLELISDFPEDDELVGVKRLDHSRKHIPVAE